MPVQSNLAAALGAAGQRVRNQLAIGSLERSGTRSLLGGLLGGADDVVAGMEKKALSEKDAAASKAFQDAVGPLMGDGYDAAKLSGLSPEAQSRIASIQLQSQQESRLGKAQEDSTRLADERNAVDRDSIEQRSKASLLDAEIQREKITAKAEADKAEMDAKSAHEQALTSNLRQLSAPIMETKDVPVPVIAGVPPLRVPMNMPRAPTPAEIEHRLSQILPQVQDAKTFNAVQDAARKMIDNYSKTRDTNPGSGSASALDTPANPEIVSLFEKAYKLQSGSLAGVTQRELNNSFQPMRPDAKGSLSDREKKGLDILESRLEILKQRQADAPEAQKDWYTDGIRRLQQRIDAETGVSIDADPTPLPTAEESLRGSVSDASEDLRRPLNDAERERYERLKRKYGR